MITLDYIDHSDTLKDFYAYVPGVQGVQRAIEARTGFQTNRKLLVDVLRKQYSNVVTGLRVKQNIELLLSENSFTVTTAHQNNLFTGPLYFIYKIIHAIRLADQLKIIYPEQNFIPVFYIGSEDADLEELNHIHLGGEKLTWKTRQEGAVGRMKADNELLALIKRLEGQLSVLPFGHEIVSLIKEYYKKDISIADATYHFVNHLFSEYGLVILQPDTGETKRLMSAVFTDDLFKQTASEIVDETAKKLAALGYKTQVNPREINLFYLNDGSRERIEKVNGKWKVVNTSIEFTEDELLAELNRYPERFSPNVILRGLYQETILPNIAFIGGGSEIAYWLQLKKLFEHYKLPFPLLVLRNSFMIIESKWADQIRKLGFSIEDFFLPAEQLVNKWVLRQSSNNIQLNGSFTELEKLYEVLKKHAVAVDVTLEKHVDALKTRSIKRLHELEKKMMKSEKRKYQDQQRQIKKIKTALFPSGGLQERYENVCYYYAKWGKDIIRRLYENSLSLEHEFVILEEIKK